MDRRRGEKEQFYQEMMAQFRFAHGDTGAPRSQAPATSVPRATVPSQRVAYGSSHPSVQRPSRTHPVWEKIRLLGDKPTVEEYLSTLRPFLLQNEYRSLQKIFDDFTAQTISKDLMMKQFQSIVNACTQRPYPPPRTMMPSRPSGLGSSQVERKIRETVAQLIRSAPDSINAAVETAATKRRKYEQERAALRKSLSPDQERLIASIRRGDEGTLMLRQHPDIEGVVLNLNELSRKLQEMNLFIAEVERQRSVQTRRRNVGVAEPQRWTETRFPERLHSGVSMPSGQERDNSVVRVTESSTPCLDGDFACEEYIKDIMGLLETSSSVSKVDSECVKLLSLALEKHMREVLEKMISISSHRHMETSAKGDLKVSSKPMEELTRAVAQEDVSFEQLLKKKREGTIIGEDMNAKRRRLEDEEELKKIADRRAEMKEDEVKSMEKRLQKGASGATTSAILGMVDKIKGKGKEGARGRAPERGGTDEAQPRTGVKGRTKVRIRPKDLLYVLERHPMFKLCKWVQMCSNVGWRAYLANMNE